MGLSRNKQCFCAWRCWGLSRRRRAKKTPRSEEKEVEDRCVVVLNLAWGIVNPWVFSLFSFLLLVVHTQLASHSHTRHLTLEHRRSSPPPPPSPPSSSSSSSSSSSHLVQSESIPHSLHSHSTPPPLLRVCQQAMETGLSASHSAAGSVVEPAAADPDGYDPSATVDDATADDATAAADYDRSSAHSDSSSPPPSPLSPSSSPLSHYLITTPYPIVESSPSLIDVARSTVHASLPPTPSLRSFRSLPVHTQSPAHSPELSPALSYAHPYTPPRWSSLTYNPMSAYPSTSPLPLPPPRSSPGPSHELQDFSLGSAPIFLSSPLPPPRDEDNATGLRHEEEVDNESQQQRQYDQASDRPRSVIDMAIDTANISEAGRTVRRNALEQRVTWSHIPRNARFFLILNGLMTLIKVRVTRERGETIE